MEINDLYNLIKDMIVKETLWLRHYNGKVVSVTDPLNKGRVKVIIYELGYSVESNGFWCSPRFLNSLYIPKVNDWIDVGFINADKDKPVYYGKANEMDNQLPKNFDKDTKTQIIFESPNDVQNIRYNEDSDELLIGAGDESFVLGDKLVADIASWAPVPNDGGASLKAVITSAILSSKVKAE